MSAELSTRKEPKQARSKATVDAILQAAARVLVAEGYEGASTNKVAKVAGVSVGSLYQYFPNKDALLLALLERHMDEMLGVLQQTAAQFFSAPIPEAVRTYVDATVRAHSIEPALHQQLTMLVPRLTSIAELLDVNKRAEVVVRAWLEAHQDELPLTDPDLSAFLLVTTVEAAIHAALMERPHSLKDGSFARELSSLVLRYLGFAGDDQAT